MPGALAGAAGLAARRSRYSTIQAAILRALTVVSTPHHRATGFDQAKDLARACEFKLIGHSTCNAADIIT